MTTKKIRVLIVDDVAETRESIRRLLSLEEGFEVVDDAANGIEAIEKTSKWRPEIILMDINMPEMDGIAATEKIMMRFPKTSIIVISVQGDQEYLRRSMQAGAKDYLVKPFSPEQLIDTINRVYENDLKRRTVIFQNQFLEEGLVSKPKVITVYSAKGGVGKSTIAVNLAVGLQSEGRRVALLDLSLLFGDIPMMLNLSQKMTIFHAVEDLDTMDTETLDNYLLTHSSGLRVLAAPLQPEQSETITAKHVEKILRLLKETYDYIIIDCPSNFHETVLAALDMADYIMLVTSRHLPAVKNNKIALETMGVLGYETSKIRLVINEIGSNADMKDKELEELYELEVFQDISYDPALVDISINQGIPLIQGTSKSKVLQSYESLVDRIIDLDGRKKQKVVKKKKPIWQLFA